MWAPSTSYPATSWTRVATEANLSSTPCSRKTPSWSLRCVHHTQEWPRERPATATKSASLWPRSRTPELWGADTPKWPRSKWWRRYWEMGQPLGISKLMSTLERTRVAFSRRLESLRQRTWCKTNRRVKLHLGMWQWRKGGIISIIGIIQLCS